MRPLDSSSSPLPTINLFGTEPAQCISSLVRLLQLTVRKPQHEFQGRRGERELFLKRNFILDCLNSLTCVCTCMLAVQNGTPALATDIAYLLFSICFFFLRSNCNLVKQWQYCKKVCQLRMGSSSKQNKKKLRVQSMRWRYTSVNQSPRNAWSNV